MEREARLRRELQARQARQEQREQPEEREPKREPGRAARHEQQELPNDNPIGSLMPLLGRCAACAGGFELGVLAVLRDTSGEHSKRSTTGESNDSFRRVGRFRAERKRGGTLMKSRENRA